MSISLKFKINNCENLLFENLRLCLFINCPLWVCVLAWASCGQVPAEGACSLAAGIFHMLISVGCKHSSSEASLSWPLSPPTIHTVPAYVSHSYLMPCLQHSLCPEVTLEHFLGNRNLWRHTLSRLVLAAFLSTVAKYLTRSTLSEEGFILAHSWKS